MNIIVHLYSQGLGDYKEVPYLHIHDKKNGNMHNNKIIETIEASGYLIASKYLAVIATTPEYHQDKDPKYDIHTSQYRFVSSPSSFGHAPS